MNGMKENAKKIQKFNKAIKLIQPMTIEQMKKAGDESYKVKVAREENLIAAYEAKKLKSEALIDEAKALIKERKKKEQKAAIAAKKKAQKAG